LPNGFETTRLEWLATSAPLRMLSECRKVVSHAILRFEQVHIVRPMRFSSHERDL
jgi:hypothetical protein